MGFAVVPNPRGYFFDGRLGHRHVNRDVFEGQWRGVEKPPILLEKHAHCDHAGSLIAVDEWVAANHRIEQGRCLREEVSEELLIPDACLRPDDGCCKGFQVPDSAGASGFLGYLEVNEEYLLVGQVPNAWQGTQEPTDTCQ